MSSLLRAILCIGTIAYLSLVSSQQIFACSPYRWSYVDSFHTFAATDIWISGISSYHTGCDETQFQVFMRIFVTFSIPFFIFTIVCIRYGMKAIDILQNNEVIVYSWKNTSIYTFYGFLVIFMVGVVGSVRSDISIWLYIIFFWILYGILLMCIGAFGKKEILKRWQNMLISAVLFCVSIVFSEWFVIETLYKTGILS